MDGFYSAVGKRARRENEVPENNDSGNKRRNSGTGRERTLPGADSTVYRILCPVNVVGSVIGKAGNDKEKDCNENEVEVEPVCPAQDALLRVHSVIVQQSSSARDNDADDKKRQHNARLLAANSQIGGLIGKGGNNIQTLRSESGAQIQIRPKDELPACAFSFGEVVVISGDATAVKKALYAVSAFLYKHPPKEQIPWTDILSATNPTSLLPSGVPALFTPPNYVPQRDSLFAHHSSGAPRVNGTYASGHLPALGGYGSEARSSIWPLTYNPALPIAPKSGNSAVEKSPEEFRIRIVCPNDKIGGVIGKGGNIIKSMRKDTGASIKVEDAQSDSDERVIVVSSIELANDGVSPTLEAVLQLQGKTSGSTSDNDNDECGICTRLLVPSKYIGCLLGKGGNIISDMRKHTGANIRIFRKEERPKCASENEELVQFSGDPSVARNALIQITKRLRANIFKDVDGATNYHTHTVTPLSSLSVPSANPLSSSNYGSRQYDLAFPR
eukprot:PITA_16921